MKNVSEKLKNLASEKRSYALQALIAHLKEAGQLADIHRLLALETSEGHNIWYEMKEQTGDTSGYVADITLAWDLANDSFHEGFSSPPQTRVSSNTGAVLVLQLRYWLILASLTSSTDHLQPALLAAVVTKNLWTLPQALAYILRIP